MIMQNPLYTNNHAHMTYHNVLYIINCYSIHVVYRLFVLTTLHVNNTYMFLVVTTVIDLLLL